MVSADAEAEMRVYGLTDFQDWYRAKTDGWHRWFAWHPVRTDAGSYWLRFVWRHGKWQDDDDGWFVIWTHSLSDPEAVPK